MKKYLCMSSAVVVIGALRVNSFSAYKKYHYSASVHAILNKTKLVEAEAIYNYVQLFFLSLT